MVSNICYFHTYFFLEDFDKFDLRIVFSDGWEKHQLAKAMSGSISMNLL